MRMNRLCRNINRAIVRSAYKIRGQMNKTERMRNWYQEKAIEWAEYALDEKYKTDAIEDMQKSIMYQKKADDCVYDPVGEFIGNIVDGTKNALHSMTKIETWVGQPAAMWLKMRKK